MDKREKFIKEVAEKVLNDLTDEYKDEIKKKPDAIRYHFTLGLYIRNQYIHNKDKGFKEDPDNLSNDIIEKIIEIICK